MNRKQTVLCAILVCFFLGSVNIAFFAEQMGLDNDPGWGTSRYFLLGLSGFFLLLIGLIIWGGKIEATFTSKFLRSRKMKIPHWAQRIFNPPLFITLPLSFALLLLASFSYYWFCTYGLLGKIPINSRFYPMLADAFRKGQLHLEIEPSAELLNLENPYDPQQYLSVNTLHDASLFEGHYYIYWGPIPAMFAALLPDSLEIGDIHLALFFGSGLAFISGAFLLIAWKRFFPSLSYWAVLPGLLIVFWGSLLPFTYFRPLIYETAILSGQFFLILGFLFLFLGLPANKPRSIFLLLSGICWVMAAGSRASLTPAILVFTGSAIWRAWNISSPNRSIFWVCIVSLGLPLGLGAIGLAWYNYARFGSILESGMCFQLSVTDMRQVCSHIFSASHVPANAFVYLLRPLSIEPSFPFIYFKWINESNFPFFIHPQPFYYYSEPVVGIAYSMPFSLFFSTITALQIRKTNNKSLGEAKYWVGTILVAAIAEFIFLLFFFTPMQRYVIDFSILLSLSAVIGFWMLIQLFNKRPLPLLIIWIISVLLLIWGIVVGFSSGISGTSRVFYETNPELFTLMKNWFE